MALEMFCGPALLYLGFSLIQIVIDLYKGLYNTTFIKFIVMVLFTIFLNILCKSGLTIISWFVVFIPFISMTVITTLLLFVFGLDPSVGNLNYNILNMDGTGNAFTYNNTGKWIITYADSTTDFITINNGLYVLNSESFQLLDTNPITITWSDGTLQTVDVINQDGSIRWTTNHLLPKYQYMVWKRQEGGITGGGYNSNNYNQADLSPCPPNMSPTEYNMYYGGHCATKNQLDNFDSNYTGNFRITYYDGVTEVININSGNYSINNSTYTLINTSPITIEWPDGTIQTLDTEYNANNSGVLRWTTNHANDQKYRYIIWEPMNNVPDYMSTSSVLNQGNISNTFQACPLGMTPQEYNSNYGGICLTGDQLGSLNLNELQKPVCTPEQLNNPYNQMLGTCRQPNLFDEIPNEIGNFITSL